MGMSYTQDVESFSSPFSPPYLKQVESAHHSGAPRSSTVQGQGRQRASPLPCLPCVRGARDSVSRAREVSQGLSLEVSGHPVKRIGQVCEGWRLCVYHISR